VHRCVQWLEKRHRRRRRRRRTLSVVDVTIAARRHGLKHVELVVDTTN
jgi:hypothetical protein